MLSTIAIILWRAAAPHGVDDEIVMSGEGGACLLAGKEIEGGRRNGEIYATASIAVRRATRGGSNEGHASARQ